MTASVEREAGRVMRFCVVGSANTAITLTVFVLLTALGCRAPAASALAFCAGAANSFHLNRRWTFSDLPPARWGRTRFVAIQAVGALTSAAGLSALQGAGWAHLDAECAVLPCVTVGLYGLSRLLVFRPPAAATSALPDARMAAR